MDELIDEISASCPKFNSYLLVDYPQSEIESAPDFIDSAWRDAIKLVGGAFTYEGYEVLSPMERARYEMTGKNVKTVSGPDTELLLIKCKFKHEGKILENYFYTPYLKDRTLFIRGRRMSLILGINERVFSRMIEKNRDGIMMRPIRSPLRFNRTDTHLVRSLTSEKMFHDFISVGYLHSKLATKRKIEPTILIYLLCKFGWSDTIARLGIDPASVSLVKTITHTDTDQYDYFAAQKTEDEDAAKKRRLRRSSDPADQYQGPLYLKVSKNVIDIPIVRKFITNFLYTMENFTGFTLEDLMDPQGQIYRIILGRIINPSIGRLQALNQADTHIASVDLFLDPITRKRINTFIPNIGDDIYDVLFYVFVNIDAIMSNSAPQNLYDKRIDVSIGILVEAYAKSIYHRIYRSNQKTTLRPKEVTGLLKNRPMAIDGAINSTKKGSTRNINPAPTISNDSWLSTCGIFKHRHDGSPKMRYDPSMCFVESIMAFTGKNIGQSGFINPMLVISKDGTGAVLRQPYCDDADSLRPFLPR